MCWLDPASPDRAGQDSGRCRLREAVGSPLSNYVASCRQGCREPNPGSSRLLIDQGVEDRRRGGLRYWEQARAHNNNLRNKFCSRSDGASSVVFRAKPPFASRHLNFRLFWVSMRIFVQVSQSCTRMRCVALLCCSDILDAITCSSPK